MIHGRTFLDNYFDNRQTLLTFQWFERLKCQDLLLFSAGIWGCFSLFQQFIDYLMNDSVLLLPV